MVRSPVSRAFLPDWVRQECLTYVGTDPEVHQNGDAPARKNNRRKMLTRPSGTDYSAHKWTRVDKRGSEKPAVLIPCVQTEDADT